MMGELLKGFHKPDSCTELAARVTYLLHSIATPAVLIQDELDGPNTLHVPCQRIAKVDCSIELMSGSSSIT